MKMLKMDKITICDISSGGKLRFKRLNDSYMALWTTEVCSLLSRCCPLQLSLVRRSKCCRSRLLFIYFLRKNFRKELLQHLKLFMKSRRRKILLLGPNLCLTWKKKILQSLGREEAFGEKLIKRFFMGFFESVAKPFQHFGLEINWCA